MLRRPTVYLAGIVVGVASFAVGLPAWASAVIAACSIFGGALVATAWFARSKPQEAAGEHDTSAESLPSALFRLEGEIWTIALNGPTFRLVDSKGLRYIHRLLERPGVEISVIDLEGATAGGRASGNAERLRLDQPSYQPVLDEQALREVRQKIKDLIEDIQEAERNNDPERASRAREELDLLETQFARATRPGGPSRVMPGPAERARTNVRHAIRNAIGKIRAQDESLGHHLDRGIRTGTYCVYEPDPDVAPTWVL